MRVLVTGGTGFIGRKFCEELRGEGREVVVLSRNPGGRKSASDGSVRVLGVGELSQAIASVEAVVHLAGESVAGRWTAKKKRDIRESRVNGTKKIVAAIQKYGKGVRVLVSASAIGFYGDRGEEELTEEEEPGRGFLAEVCRDWEEAAREAETLGVRVVLCRFGIVLGSSGGALKTMLFPARLGLSGPLGSGRQWWSWVHREDAVALLLHAIREEKLTGALNATSPHPVRQRDFALTLGKVLKKPAFLKAPEWLVRRVVGEFAGELLASQRVYPAKALGSGYLFKYPELAESLQAAVRENAERAF